MAIASTCTCRPRAQEVGAEVGVGVNERLLRETMSQNKKQNPQMKNKTKT